MVTPTITKSAAIYCVDCCYWLPGQVVEMKYLDDDYVEGTPLDDVGTYTQETMPCGCDAEDTGFLTADHFWQCQSCKKCWGNDLPSAMKCCERSILRKANRAEGEVTIGETTYRITDDGKVTVKT